MITASHNPAVQRHQDVPRGNISSETGGDAIATSSCRDISPRPAPGKIIQRDVTGIRDHLSFIDVSKVKSYKIAVDAGNGMAGMVIPRVFQKLPCQLVPLYFELDGTFPSHPASPIEPENTEELRRVVPEQHCDMGIAFDGDADRMFLVDEKGRLLGGDMVTALVARSLLRKHPASTILYNLICSRSVPELIEREGGRAIRTRVGHSFIKATMRQENAMRLLSM
jgi:phosphomannomutase